MPELRRSYSIIQDPLNGYRWQVRVRTHYPDGTHVDGDAGEACDTFIDALEKESKFMAGEA